MKTLEEVGSDLSGLYEEYKAGKVDTKVAMTLRNIAVPIVKIHELKLQREQLESSLSTGARRIGKVVQPLRASAAKPKKQYVRSA